MIAGKIQFVAWFQRVSEDSCLRLARHVVAVEIDTRKARLSCGEPHGIEITAERVTVPETNRRTDLQVAGNEQAEVVVHHGSSAYAGERQSQSRDDLGTAKFLLKISHSEPELDTTKLRIGCNRGGS